MNRSACLIQSDSKCVSRLYSFDFSLVLNMSMQQLNGDLSGLGEGVRRAIKPVYELSEKELTTPLSEGDTAPFGGGDTSERGTFSSRQLVLWLEGGRRVSAKLGIITAVAVTVGINPKHVSVESVVPKDRNEIEVRRQCEGRVRMCC